MEEHELYRYESDDDERRVDMIHDYAKALMKREPERKFYEHACWNMGNDPWELVSAEKVVFVVTDNCKELYRSKEHQSPTRMAAFLCFAESIAVTGDEHHRILDAIDFKGVEGEVEIFEFVSGS